MPHTYYAPPRERKQDDSLQQLAALAQIFGGLNSSGQRAQESQQQNALAVLGLLSQQQHQQAQLALQKSAQADESGRYWGGELPAKYAAQDLTRQDNEANRAIQQKQLDEKSGEYWGGTYPLQQQELANTARHLDDVSGQFWSGTYPLAQQDSANTALHQRALEALAQKNAEMEQGKLGEEKRYHDLALSQAGFNTASGLPGTTPQMIPGLAQGFGLPQGDALVAHAQKAMAKNNAGQLQQMLGPVYSQFGHDPVKAQQALDTIWKVDPRLSDPTTLENLRPFLQQQNESLYHPQGAGVQPTGLDLTGSSPQLQSQYAAEMAQQAKEAQDAQAQQAIHDEQAKQQQIKDYIFTQKIKRAQGNNPFSGAFGF